MDYLETKAKLVERHRTKTNEKKTQHNTTKKTKIITNKDAQKKRR